MVRLFSAMRFISETSRKRPARAARRLLVAGIRDSKSEHGAPLSKLSVCAVLLVALLAGCGTKGDLYLPEPERKPQTDSNSRR